MPRIASSIKSWNPGNLRFLQSDWFISENLRFCGIRDTAACRQFVQLSICYWNPGLNPWNPGQMTKFANFARLKVWSWHPRY